MDANDGLGKFFLWVPQILSGVLWNSRPIERSAAERRSHRQRQHDAELGLTLEKR